MSGFSHVKLLLFSSTFSCCTLWKQNHYHSPYFNSVELCSPSVRAIYINYLEFLCMETSFLPYLFNHLLKAVYAHGYLDYKPILLYFAQILPPLPIGNSFSSRLLYPFDILHCFVVGGGWFILLKLLLFGTTRYCRLILYIFSLSPRISPFSQEPWLLLFERVVLKTKIRVVGAFIAPGCHLVFSLV